MQFNKFCIFKSSIATKVSTFEIYTSAVQIIHAKGGSFKIIPLAIHVHNRVEQVTPPVIISFIINKGERKFINWFTPPYVAERFFKMNLGYCIFSNTNGIRNRTVIVSFEQTKDMVCRRDLQKVAMIADSSDNILIFELLRSGLNVVEELLENLRCWVMWNERQLKCA